MKFNKKEYLRYLPDEEQYIRAIALKHIRKEKYVKSYRMHENEEIKRLYSKLDWQRSLFFDLQRKVHDLEQREKERSENVPFFLKGLISFAVFFSTIGVLEVTSWVLY